MNDSPKREVVLFGEALQLTGAERAAYLDRECAGDLVLRTKVEKLLGLHDTAGHFLEVPPSEADFGSQPTFPGEKPGDRIDRYKLLQQIGEGGCGVVYMAEQEEPIRRKVALKVIKPGMDTRSVIARFEAERQALALMDHPSIAKVFDAGATASGRPYFVMELVRGVKITEYCDEHALNTASRLALFVQICQAVQHAHQKGIIHRDIKPSNVLVTTTVSGVALPVVIDFGIAKATTDQRLTDRTFFTAFEMLVGTPAYMSPEQADLSSANVDTRTDIYSLGVLLYELLTGSTPFDSQSLLKAGLDEVRRVIRETEPPRPSTRLVTMPPAELTTTAERRSAPPPVLIRSVRGDLDWIVMKALEKDRSRRYDTANGLAVDVQRFLASEPVSARPPSPLYRLSKAAVRHKFLFATITTIALLLVASLVIVSAALQRQRMARQEADTSRTEAEREKKRALEEALKSGQITHFLTEMLQSVGPSVARGRNTQMLREILDKTAARVEHDLPNQFRVQAELKRLLGRVYTELGQYDQATNMHNAALALYSQLDGPRSAEAANSISDLGSIFWRQKDLAQAEQMHAAALAMRREIFGEKHLDVARSLNDLGQVYRRQGKSAHAEQLTRAGLAIRRALLPASHLDVADSLRNLGILQGDQGKWSEAEAILRDVLEMRRRLAGPDHDLVAASLLDLGWALGGRGDLPAAEALEREAVAIRRKILEPDHPDLAKSYYALGDRMRQRGKLPEARAYLESALSIQSRFGANNSAYLESLRALALTLEAEAKPEEAEALHRRAVDGWLARGEANTPQALPELNSLGRLLLESNKLDDAERFLDSVLTPDLLEQKTSADLISIRVDLLGRRSRWKEAAENGILLVRHQPHEHYRYHTLAPLLVLTRNRAEYDRLCRDALARFRNADNPYIAERLAKDCLLWPMEGLDLELVDKLTDTAVREGARDGSLPFFQVSKALAQYRLAHIPEAIEWASKTLLPTSQETARAHACGILAMAYWRRGEKDRARDMLSNGNALTPSFISHGKTVDLGQSWLAWVFARITLDEAATLLESNLPN